ncbi:MAG: hypothetical protein Q3M30_04285 [Candidatus Electrothrix sp. Rat3]|nr:hypothetical protein [Candidatus Electrothrix rattekaaiensis]
MKKTTVRSVTIGAVILTAVTAGAWLIFFAPQENRKFTSSILPSVAQKTVRQEPNLFPESDVPPAPSEQPPKQPSEQGSATSAATTDAVDSSSEDTSEDTNQENQENALKAEGVISAEAEDITEIGSSEQTASDKAPVPQTGVNEPTASQVSQVSTLPNHQESEAADRTEVRPAYTTDYTTTGQTVALAGKEGVPQDSADPIKQIEEQKVSGPSCKEVSPTLTNFFNMLEKKNYGRQEKNSGQPLQEHFNALATQLVNNPPVVIHETDDLYTILTNTAHFFRILGKDNMRLLRKVLKQETADFEDVAAEIFRLTTGGKQCVSGNKRLAIPFTTAYEYAGFFLNTLGGRSYLFRRDPGTRLLVNYYAVLILDQANRKQLNRYGLDISEQLPWLIQEMEANNRLTHKEKYIDKLYELAENYQALP